MAKLICSKRVLLHDALRRSQYFIPDLKSNLSSMLYLREVKAGSIFALLTSQVNVLNCTRPPSNAELNRLLLKALEQTSVPEEQTKGKERLIEHLNIR